MIKKYKIILVLVITSGLASSCCNDLNTVPLSNQVINGTTVFDTEEGYKEFLSKLYGGLTLTGQQGEYGDPEIVNPDEGETSFLRTYWTAQELSTDEALSSWNDPKIQSFNFQTWGDNNALLSLLYQRIFINIAFCNEYIRAVDDKIESLSGGFRSEVETYRAEAITLRALYYYFALDLWGNVPMIRPEDGVGAYSPSQISRANLFDHIESQLLEALPDLKDAGQNEYARVDKATVWAILAKMYLNAEVYSGTPRYDECIEYCNKIIQSGQYTLVPQYKDLFLADNDFLDREIIFPIAEDGLYSRNYGGVTFIIHGATGDGTTNGVTGGWYGHRPTTSFVESLFTDTNDQRAVFETDGQSSLIINDPIQFNQGYRCSKFKNVTSNGNDGQDPTFVDTDFPLFRLTDVYLMYAEAVLRGGSSGNTTDALKYVNEIRERAYGNTSGNITAGELTLDFLLKERGRELYWEAHRRTDLIRFGQFTSGNLKWDWKGGSLEGSATSDHLNLYPLPAFDLGLNKNLKQNPGY